MPLTDAERKAINDKLGAIEEQITAIALARDDAYALLRIANRIPTDETQDAVWAGAKGDMKAAAQVLVDML